MKFSAAPVIPGVEAIETKLGAYGFGDRRFLVPTA